MRVSCKEFVDVSDGVGGGVTVSVRVPVTEVLAVSEDAPVVEAVNETVRLQLRVASDDGEGVGGGVIVLELVMDTDESFRERVSDSVAPSVEVSVNVSEPEKLDDKDGVGGGV